MIQQRVFIIEQYFKNIESLGMKHIFMSIALLIAKIANFEEERLAKNKCIWCGFWRQEASSYILYDSLKK